MKIFEEALMKESQLEREKQLFGGNIYAMAHKFPSLYITNKNEGLDDCYNVESFTNYTNLVNHIADSCGSDLALLFAESYKLYEIDIDDPTQQYDVKNKIIIDFCTEALAHLSLALDQSKKLLDILNSFESNDELNLEITGNNYCFIVMMLNNLFYYYTTIVNFIINKRYLNIEFITSISERLYFIVSNEFESLRRMFKVVECYREIETKHTFH